MCVRHELTPETLACALKVIALTAKEGRRKDDGHILVVSLILRCTSQLFCWRIVRCRACTAHGTGQLRKAA